MIQEGPFKKNKNNFRYDIFKDLLEAVIKRMKSQRLLK